MRQELILPHPKKSTWTDNRKRCRLQYDSFHVSSVVLMAKLRNHYSFLALLRRSSNPQLITSDLLKEQVSRILLIRMRAASR